MPQFFVPRKNIHGRAFSLDETESNHLIRVLRKTEGDAIRIFDGEGRVFPARITDASDPAAVKGELLESWPKELPPFSPAEGRRTLLHIYPALLKGPRFEWLLEKAAELGVHAIRPTVTERTLIRLKSEQIRPKLERWRKILLASAKQCGRQDIPAIEAPSIFEKALGASGEDPRFILWEREDQRRLSDLVSDVRCANPEASGVPIHLYFGPEGGFADREIIAARARGLITAGLGKDVLRAETAAIAASSLILL